MNTPAKTAAAHILDLSAKVLNAALELATHRRDGFDVGDEECEQLAVNLREAAKRLSEAATVSGETIGIKAEMVYAIKRL